MRVIFVVGFLALLTTSAVADHVDERIDARPEEGPPGAAFTIEGEDWIVCEDHAARQGCRGSDVEIHFEPPGYSGSPFETPLLADIRAQGDGTFEVAVSVPAGVEPGLARIVAYGETDPPDIVDAPTLAADHPFTVTAPPPPTSEPTPTPTQPPATPRETLGATPAPTRHPPSPSPTLLAVSEDDGIPVGAMVGSAIGALALGGGIAALVMSRRRRQT